MTVIFFGILWGFIEMTLGGFLHLLNFPMTGELLGAIGLTILFFAYRSGLKPVQLAMIPVFAAVLKLVDVFIFHLPLMHVTIIRPAVAILMQGFAFVLVSSFLKDTGKLRILACSLFISVFSVGAFFALFSPAELLFSAKRIVVMSILTFAGFICVAAMSKKRALPLLQPRVATAFAVLLLAATVSLKYLIHF